MIFKTHSRKKSNSFWLSGLIVCLSLIYTSSLFANDGLPKVSRVENPCSNSERWNLTKDFPKDYVEDFEKGYKEKASAIRSFSDAIGLRKMALLPQTRSISEYWISRALLQANLPHVAANGFEMILSRSANFYNLNAQLGAIACLTKIHHQYPSISLPGYAYARLFEIREFLRLLEFSESDKKIMAEAALIHLQQQLSSENPNSSSIEHTLSFLKGQQTYETFGKALWASRRSAHQQAILEWSSFLGYHEGKKVSQLPDSLKRHVDTAHVLLARAYYGAKAFQKASEILKNVKKNSNELTESLSELSWAYLLDDKLQDAIGTATSLQAGAMKNTWAPEAPMVQAMAMNELCQFPESIRAIGLFRKLYEKPYKWLHAHDGKSGDDNFYKLAIGFLKKSTDVPVRVGTEWVRSPVFLSSQQEINLLFDEAKTSLATGKKGAHEQRNFAESILKTSQILLYDIKLARKRFGEDEALSPDLKKRLLELRRNIILYKRLMAAAPVFRSVSKFHAKQSPVIQKNLISRINKEIFARNTRMKYQLEEISENVQLIEVEIYNGATHDIIWQNAHPEYREMAQEMNHDEEGAAPRSQVWDWGRTTASSDEETEIWEDELGAFKADLFDNCSSKNKYLALKLRKK